MLGRKIGIPYAQYLAEEAVSQEKHEWYDGHVIAMAGGTEEHAVLGASIIGVLARGGPNPTFRVLSAQMRVRCAETGPATYPDASIVCGKRLPHPEDKDACRNPTSLFEVLSPTTEGYDRREKLDHYQTIASLRDYVLVATGRNHIDHYSRDESGVWTRRGYGPGESFSLTGVEVTLSIDAIYTGVEAVREVAEG